jgi:sugar transferase (PEP-CTERM/EpsH1 system associated)
VNILFLAHRVPYPPDKGERIRAFHEIEFLAKRHTVDLFCLASTPEEVQQGDRLRRWCRQVAVERVKAWEVTWRAALAFAKGEAASVAVFYSKRLHQRVQAEMATRDYDLIFLNCSSMAQYVPEPVSCPVIVDFVDTDSAKWLQYAERERFPRSWIYRREGRCLSALEQKLVRTSAASLVVSSKEARQLSPENPRLNVISNGVGSITGNGRLPEELSALRPYIVFVGTMSYLPNVDAVTYFAREIFPLVRQKQPSVDFVIVGRDPSRSVRALSRLPGVRVMGTVPSVDPYLQRAQVAVAPFRISQGVHNKILEAIVAGVPLVCTSLPVEGLPAPLKSVVTVADDPADFADRVVCLLEDSDLRARSRQNAAAVSDSLRWEHVLDPLNMIIEEVTMEKQEMMDAVPVQMPV